jgi:hypothetical protein
MQTFQHLHFQLAENLVSGGAGTLKRIEALVVPVEHDLLGASLQVDHMNIYRIHLTNTIQPANALLKQIRVERQIEQDKMVRKLKVPALAADL